MIKKLEIKNFKSFLEEKIELNSGLNLIIGLNGQGKSNFYSALKFLFKKEMGKKVSPEIKRGLLNDKLIGESLHVKAFLDNSMGNFPI